MSWELPPWRKLVRMMVDEGWTIEQLSKFYGVSKCALERYIGQGN